MVLIGELLHLAVGAVTGTATEGKIAMNEGRTWGGLQSEMGSNAMPNAGADAIRRELHALLDHIPEGDVATVHKFLRSLVDPVELALLRAPDDDESESEAEREAVSAALADPPPDVPFERIRRSRR